jgi:hypothetical protein
MKNDEMYTAWGTYEGEEKALRALCRKLKDRDHFEELDTDWL